MTRGRLLLVAIAAAAVVGVWALLPPAAITLAPIDNPRLVRGAIHVHSTRSDGASPPESIADAARRAALDFVVLTDHGDATRQPDAARYVSGVLLIDAVEISTSGGHYVALGLPRAPYRLAGEPRDVIEDVHRLGGFGIAAHPDSPKSDLRWREWQAPFDGIEWLNVDSEWRDERRGAIARALVSYWFRGPEALVSLFDRPSQTLARWDALTARRRVVSVAAQDAHGKFSLDDVWETGRTQRSIAVPSYESAFRAFATRLELERPLGRTPATAALDAIAIVDAIRAGRSFAVIDGVAGPAALTFVARASGQAFTMGSEIAAAGPIELRAQVRPPLPAATLVLVKNGREVLDGYESIRAVHEAGEGPATYRVEVRLTRAPGTPPVPWILGNPIYVTRGVPRVTAISPAAVLAERPMDDRPVEQWAIERHPQCEGRVEPELDPIFHKRLKFSWRLAGGARASQYAALATPLRGAQLGRFTQLAFTASASRPMRLSVQLRSPDHQGQRWQRSVYLDTTPTEIVVPLAQMSAIEAPAGTPLPVDRLDTLLFVVDTVNTPPGASGEVWLDRIRWQQTALPMRRAAR
jgi:hypothetical protein